MAPRSQEPQVITKDDCIKKYFVTLIFTLGNRSNSRISYIIQGTKDTVENIALKNFKIDFPFEDITATVSIAEYTNNLMLKQTSSKEILQLIKKYLDYQDSNSVKEIKFMGELKTTNEIREYYHIPTKDLTEEVEQIVIDNVTSPEECRDWYAEYNIKIGTEKYRKGTIIRDVDSEVEARKKLGLYIKKNFSRVRSITKVSLKVWNNEKEYSNPLIENIPLAETSKVAKVQTLDELIDENFPEDLLNSQVFQVVVKPTKIRPKDFEENFMLFQDKGQSEEDIFQNIKEDVPNLKKKNLAIKKVNFRQILTTKRYKTMLQSSRFKNLIAEGESGMDAILVVQKEIVDDLDSQEDNALENFAKKLLNELQKIEKIS